MSYEIPDCFPAIMEPKQKNLGDGWMEQDHERKLSDDLLALLNSYRGQYSTNDYCLALGNWLKLNLDAVVVALKAQEITSRQAPSHARPHET
jgi:hypothetical protein